MNPRNLCYYLLPGSGSFYFYIGINGSDGQFEMNVLYMIIRLFALFVHRYFRLRSLVVSRLPMNDKVARKQSSRSLHLLQGRIIIEIQSLHVLDKLKSRRRQTYASLANICQYSSNRRPGIV